MHAAGCHCVVLCWFLKRGLADMVCPAQVKQFRTKLMTALKDKKKLVGPQWLWW